MPMPVCTSLNFERKRLILDCNKEYRLSTHIAGNPHLEPGKDRCIGQDMLLVGLAEGMHRLVRERAGLTQGLVS